MAPTGKHGISPNRRDEAVARARRTISALERKRDDALKAQDEAAKQSAQIENQHGAKAFLTPEFAVPGALLLVALILFILGIASGLVSRLSLGLYLAGALLAVLAVLVCVRGTAPGAAQKAEHLASIHARQEDAAKQAQKAQHDIDRLTAILSKMDAEDQQD